MSSPSRGGQPDSLDGGVRTENERELVREAAQRVLAGRGLITIARDWNRRTIRGPLDGPWTAPTLRRALLSSRMAGMREHGVDPSGRTLGQLRPAVWKEALDRQTWDRVRAVLLNPQRNTNVRTPTKYLLTGLIHCGTCGSRMSSRPRDDHTKRYLCAGNQPGHQLAIVAQPVDELVSQQVLDVLVTPSLREALLDQTRGADGDSLGRALADLGAAQSRLQRLDDDFYVRGSLPGGRYRSIRVKLEREIERLHLLTNAATKRRIALHPDPGAYWAEADLDQRRQLVRLVVERVDVVPGRPVSAGLTHLGSESSSVECSRAGPREGGGRSPPIDVTFAPQPSIPVGIVGVWGSTPAEHSQLRKPVRIRTISGPPSVVPGDSSRTRMATAQWCLFRNSVSGLTTAEPLPRPPSFESP